MWFPEVLVMSGRSTFCCHSISAPRESLCSTFLICCVALKRPRPLVHSSSSCLMISVQPLVTRGQPQVDAHAETFTALPQNKWLLKWRQTCFLYLPSAESLVLSSPEAVSVRRPLALFSLCRPLLSHNDWAVVL